MRAAARKNPNAVRAGKTKHGRLGRVALYRELRELPGVVEHRKRTAGALADMPVKARRDRCPLCSYWKRYETSFLIGGLLVVVCTTCAVAVGAWNRRRHERWLAEMRAKGAI